MRRGQSRTASVLSIMNDKLSLIGGSLLLVLLFTLEGGHALITPPSPTRLLQHRHRSSGNVVTSSVAPSPPPFNLNSGVIPHDRIGQHQPSHFIYSSSSCGVRRNVALRSTSSDDATATSSTTQEETEAPISITLIVGIASALVGYIYHKCLKIGFNLLWRQFPNSNLSKAIPSNRHILCMMTLGGAVVATLSTLFFPTLFSAHEYVHVLSKENDDDDDTNKMDKFPGVKYIFPLLGLSLITSISGFSLGPEAPMVGAGSLVGVNLGRRYIKKKKESGDSRVNASKLEETMAYVGAAGALTGAMNFPLAGPIFALECTSRRAGLAGTAGKNWGAVMMASFAGMAVVRGLLVPNAHVGGHFTHSAKAAIGVLHGREMVLVGLGMGVCGAVVGTCFHKVVTFLKSVIWPKNKSSSKAVVIGKKVLVAMLIGYISTLFPQTMFWGEPSMQCMVDGQCTPFSATPHGIPAAMQAAARVNPNQPFASGWAALQVGLAKFSAITLATSAKFPGGVIFPLLSNGAPLGHALVSALGPLLPTTSSSLVAPMMIMSLMGALLTSITRTPLASVLILAFTASGITPLSVFLPGALMASYVSVWVSERLSKDSFFSYSE
ncbi:hypothetical protein ACHAXM_011946 [Skeletonema potamos]